MLNPVADTVANANFRGTTVDWYIKADEINLLDITQAMENTIKINRCLEKDKFCSRSATKDCPIRSFYCRFQDELESRLASITVDDLLNKTYNTKEDKAMRL